MGLVGRNNTVPSGTKIEEYERARYLNEDNIIDRSVDLQTEKAIYTGSLGNQGSESVTVTDDFILTNIVLSSDSVLSVALTISINGDVILDIVKASTIAINIPYPEILIREGDVINVNSVGGAFPVTIIGYKA